MFPEAIYDISESVETATLAAWEANTQHRMDYLMSGMNLYSEDPRISPLWWRIIRSAVENGSGEGNGAREVRLFGSFAVLDAVNLDFQQRGTRLEITADDERATHHFTERFLIDPRWSTLTEARGSMTILKPDKIDEYRALMEETGGPTVDMGLLREVMELKGRHRLLDTLERLGAVLALKIDPSQQEALEEVFMRGAWTVISSVVLKYSSLDLAVYLTNRRGNPQQN